MIASISASFWPFSLIFTMLWESLFDLCLFLVCCHFLDESYSSSTFLLGLFLSLFFPFFSRLIALHLSQSILHRVLIHSLVLLRFDIFPILLRFPLVLFFLHLVFVSERTQKLEFERLSYFILAEPLLSSLVLVFIADAAHCTGVDFPAVLVNVVKQFIAWGFVFFLLNGTLS